MESLEKKAEPSIRILVFHQDLVDGIFEIYIKACIRIFFLCYFKNFLRKDAKTFIQSRFYCSHKWVN